MAKMNMKAITMAFKEVLLDEEGNPVKDNEGKPVYVVCSERFATMQHTFPALIAVRQKILPASPKV